MASEYLVTALEQHRKLHWLSKTVNRLKIDVQLDELSPFSSYVWTALVQLKSLALSAGHLQDLDVCTERALALTELILLRHLNH